jgi:hypothetical protein
LLQDGQVAETIFSRKEVNTLPQFNPLYMPAHIIRVCFSALVLLSLTSMAKDNLERRLFTFEEKVNGSKFFGEVDQTHAETFGFATQPISTPRIYKFNRNNALTMNMTSKGAGITLLTNCYNFSATSPVNPAHVAGIRTFYEMNYNYATNPASTATVEISFQTGLPVNGYLLFLDFDGREEISIKAYNSADVLIPYSDMTFARHNGMSATGSTILTTVFTDLGSSYTGRVEDESGTSRTDLVVSLQSSQVIKRLVYEIQMNPTGSTTLNNTMGFNFVAPTTASRVYVNHAAGGANNGTSWTDAYTSLQTGIDNAFPGDELWVAKGTYKPSYAYERTNTSRFYHFRIPNAVAFYGGFVSGQTTTASRSDYGIGGTNETILSGDLSGDDNYTVTPWTGMTENSYHVIYHPKGFCMGTGTIMDGLTIQGGNANGSTADADGAGAYITQSMPISFTDVHFTRNSSLDDGSAIYLINGDNAGSSQVTFTGSMFLNNSSSSDATVYCTNNSSAIFRSVDFSNNTVTTDGGAFLATTSAAVTLENVSILNNTAGNDGGGLVAISSAAVTLENVSISNNTAGNDGGGVSVRSSATLTGSNVLISGNSATGDDGGGIFINGTTVTLNNATIVNNSAKSSGGGVRTTISPALLTLNNSIVWGNVITLEGGNQIDVGTSTTVRLNYVNTPSTSVSAGLSSQIQSAGTLTLGTGNITTDPQFRNSVTGDYRLTSGSPAADAGNDTYNSLTTDIRGAGFGRKLLKTDLATTGTIDIGAYEYNSTTDVNKSWTGAVSNLWNVAGNWSDNAVPHANDIIELNSGTAQLNTDFTTDRNVTVGGTATLTLLPTSSISVSAAGTLNMGGRPVTLKSDASGTARIGQILGTLSGATNVTVERYMPAGRKWRFFCAPLTGSTNNSVFANWQNNDVPNGNTGVEIWGPAGTNNPSSANNGLAVGPHPSMRYYDAGWQAVTNTNDSKLFDGTTNNGYALFQTGPYNNGSTTYIGGPGNLPNGIATTLSATGSLISGTHTKSLTAATAGQYFLVANPYASPVNPTSFTDAGTINRTNLDNILYMWDAKPGGTNGLGRYVSYNISTGQYSSIGAGTGFTAHTTQIQSGQAFFVRATAAGAASLVFRETSKGSLVNMDMMGDATPKTIPSLRFQLWQDTVNYDGAVAYFHPGASRSIDKLDGTKMLNGTDNLGLRRDGKTLVFEHHPELTATDTLFLHLSQMRQLPYRMRIEAEGLILPTGMDARLIDRSSGKETTIDLKKPLDVEFAVGADSASSGGRFMVLFSVRSGAGVQTPEPGNTGLLKVFPNPVAGSSAVSVTLDASKAPWSLRVLDPLGRAVWQQTGVSAPRIEIPVSGLSRGLYHLVATDVTGTRTVSDIVRQ